VNALPHKQKHSLNSERTEEMAAANPQRQSKDSEKEKE
jgi:hypothetical protein